MEKIEYKVRLVTRYVVTRFYKTGEGVGSHGGSEVKGEFDNAETAYEVGYALAKEEHNRNGWPLGDERIKYPQRVLREKQDEGLAGAAVLGGSPN